MLGLKMLARNTNVRRTVKLYLDIINSIQPHILRDKLCVELIVTEVL